MELKQEFNQGDLVTTLQNRRHKLSCLFPHPIVLWSGQAPHRNFAANRYPFRASSHFLYFAGIPLKDAVIYLYEMFLY